MKYFVTSNLQHSGVVYTRGAEIEFGAKDDVAVNSLLAAGVIQKEPIGRAAEPASEEEPAEATTEEVPASEEEKPVESASRRRRIRALSPDTREHDPSANL